MRRTSGGWFAIAVAAALAVSAAPQHALSDPSTLTERAPAVFTVNVETTKGSFAMAVHRDWSPHGADRFYNLVKYRFYDNCRFFRVIDKFVAEFGINGDPSIQKVWTNATFPDDPVRQSNRRGFVAFNNPSDPPHARATQVFINLSDNLRFDQSFPPFGEVVSGMDIVDRLYSGYAGGPQNQFLRVLAEGNAFLAASFPNLDFIKAATLAR